MIPFDWLYLVMLAPAMLLAAYAQMRVSSAYGRASRIPTSLTGAQAARRILDHEGLRGVGIEAIGGHLTDHYDPRSKVLRLSPDVYRGNSLAAVGIAAHEAGHAIQDARNYGPLVVRNAAVPLASTGGGISMMVFLSGFLISMFSQVLGQWLFIAAIVLYSCVVFFQLVNLPVEFNASTRAKAALADLGMVDAGGGREVKRVLDAAALTYVAATLSAILTLLYMVLRSGLLGGSRE